MNIIVLKISEEIPVDGIVTETYTPPAGKIITLRNFQSSGMFQYKLIWKYNSGEDEIIWSLVNSDKIPTTRIKINPEEINGVNSIAIQIINNKTYAAISSCILELDVTDVIQEIESGPAQAPFPTINIPGM